MIPVDLNTLVKSLSALVWKNRQPEGDSVVAAIRTKTANPTQMLVLDSEVDSFNPTIHSLAVEVITNESQLQMAKEELQWLSENVPEVTRYLTLSSLVDDYEEDLREY